MYFSFVAKSSKLSVTVTFRMPDRSDFRTESVDRRCLATDLGTDNDILEVCTKHFKYPSDDFQPELHRLAAMDGVQ
jgi:hypothetical protein